jgi:hypothetical protein
LIGIFPYGAKLSPCSRELQSEKIQVAGRRRPINGQSFFAQSGIAYLTPHMPCSDGNDFEQCDMKRFVKRTIKMEFRMWEKRSKWRSGTSQLKEGKQNGLKKAAG